MGISHPFPAQANGTVDDAELGAALGLDTKATGVFKSLDHDGSGQVHYHEFLAATIEAEGLLDPETLQDTFDPGRETGASFYLGRFPLVSADFWTSDRLSERSRSVDAFSGTRARGTLTLKRR